MAVQVWGAAAALVTAAVLVGNALVALGMRCRSAAPAVGLVTLIVLASIAIKLPGRATTSAVILLVAVLVSAIILIGPWVRHREVSLRSRLGRRSGRVPLLTIALTAFGTAIPFIANGRVGLLGVSFDNDTANHLQWAEALRSPVVGARYGLPDGYPLGPHSLFDALASGLGIRLDLALTALLIATTVITALVAASALRERSVLKQVVAGVTAALFYLVAAYYAEAAFKEPLMGLILLALVLHLEEAPRWAPLSSGQRLLYLLPLAFLIAGALYVYSYTSLAWIGLTIVIWLVAEAAMGRIRVRWRGISLAKIVPFIGAAAVLVLVLAPSAERIARFASQLGISPAAGGAISVSNVGNLAHPLPALEAFGIWNSFDFRFSPANPLHAGLLAGIGVILVLVGWAWSIGRRELVLPAAIAACAIVYWRSSHGQSPYVSAKALVIPGPVLAVTALRAGLRTDRVSLPGWAWLSRWAIVLAFLVLSLHSTYLALRDGVVWPAQSTRELLALDKATHGQSVLFLGASDYASWIFQDSKMSALAPNTVSMAQAAPRRTKSNVYGTAFDFDSVDSATLNRFQWVVTSNSPYASQAPAAYSLVRATRMYELWHRVGPVVPRLALDPPGAPGAVLDCHTRSGRALSRRLGVAAVMAAPVLASMSGLLPGQSATLRLPLRAGRWSLSLQYISAVPVTVRAGGHRWVMPAYLDRPGPPFSIGTLSASGPVIVTVTAGRPSALSGPLLAALPSALVAVREPAVRTVVPLDRACGRYVDWYRLGATAPATP